MADDKKDEIDLDQVIWDPRYRRSVIEMLNRALPRDAAPSQEPTQPEPKTTEPR